MSFYVLNAHDSELLMPTPIVSLKFEKYQDEGPPLKCTVEVFSDGAYLEGDELESFFEFIEPEEALLRAVHEVINQGYVLSSNQADNAGK